MDLHEITELTETQKALLENVSKCLDEASGDVYYESYYENKFPYLNHVLHELEKEGLEMRFQIIPKLYRHKN